MTKRSSNSHNSSVLLVTEHDYQDVLMTLLEHATSSIDIIAYSFAIGSASGVLARKSAPFEVATKLVELKKKLRTKIKIRLYLEGRRETSERNRVTGEFLKKTGVQVRYGATHAKGFCIDGRYVLFGSTNLTNQSITKNYETNLLLDSKETTVGFLKYFEHLWRGGEHGGVKLKAPLYADGSFKDMLIDVIDRAQTRIDFSIYFFHHSEIENALVRAHARGVKVTGLVHDHRTFARSYVQRTHGTTRRLREAGINALYLAPPDFFTHSKYLIADRKEIVLGTGNWLHEDVKVHPQLYVHLKEPAVAKQLAADLGRKLKSARKFRTPTA